MKTYSMPWEICSSLEAKIKLGNNNYLFLLKFK